MKDIYLDHSATTPTDPKVVESMLPYFTKQYGNPLSRHRWGESTRQAIDTARQQIAGLIRSSPDEIYFTGTGSESNNLAIKGLAMAYQKKGRHIILSGLEHESVLFSAHYLDKQGYETTIVPFDKFGLTDPDDIRNAIRKDTILVSVIHASHEIGTIQPIADIGRICREKKIIFFSDGIATIGTLPVDVTQLFVDAMSFAGNMFYGPKGIAGLYLRQGVRIEPLIHGGKQEQFVRSGTHNVPGIVGLGTAAELAKQELEQRLQYTRQLRDTLWSGLSKKIDKIYLTGHPEYRLPNHLSFCVEYLEGEALLLLLELDAGLAGSSGSICGEDTNQASQILLGMGLDEKLARGAIRFTIGKDNTSDEIQYVIKTMPSLVERLRKKSVEYQKNQTISSTGL